MVSEWLTQGGSRLEFTQNWRWSPRPGTRQSSDQARFGKSTG